jgi:hypothetical protein
VLLAGRAQAAVEHTHDTEKGGFGVAALTFDVTVDPGDGRYLLAALVVGGGHGGAVGELRGDASRPHRPPRRRPVATAGPEWWGLAAPPVGTGSFQVLFTGPPATRTPPSSVTRGWRRWARSA